MAIRLLQQTSVAENGSYLSSSTSDHSSNDKSATKATTEKTFGRKRHSSICLSSPTKKHCSLSHVGEHVYTFKAEGISPAVQPGTECIVLGKQFR